MRNAIGLLACLGAALLSGLTARADTPTLILDTYGNGAQWAVTGPSSPGAPIGYDPDGGGANFAPNDPYKAAYAAMPFTVTALPSGQNVINSIDIVLNIQSATGLNSNIPALTGVILKVPAGVTSLAAAGITQIGSSFKFDTSGSADPINPLLGSGITQLVAALNLSQSNITLVPNQNYLLLIEPKDGLNPGGSDLLLDYAIWLARASSRIAQSGGSLMTAYTKVSQAQDTFLSTNIGDALTLQPVTVGNGQIAYFGARISVAAPASATVTGTVALEGVNDLSKISPNAPLGLFHISFRTVGTRTEIAGFDVPLTNLGAAGTFTVPGAPVGTYDVNIKGMKNLSQTVSIVNVSGAVTLPTVTLNAGDTNNDNTVDPTDFGNFVSAYNSDSSVPGTGYTPTCDFNFDGVVDPTDFGLFVGNYNTVGS